MSKFAGLLKIITIIILIGGLVMIYISFVEPWYKQWGATEDERIQNLPGDEIVTNPDWGYTQAITIKAPAEEVWQWLVQIGQGRGGFYSYELLENIIGCDIHNANQILPEFQPLAAGDNIKLHPKAPGLPVVSVASGEKMVLGIISENQTDASRWSFVMEKSDANTTRLIARFQNRFAPTPGNFVIQRIFIQPTSLFMQKKMLNGLKQRAEGKIPPVYFDNIQVGLWLFLAFLLIVIVLSILIRRHWIRLIIPGLTTGLLLLLFIAWQPSIFLGIPLVILNLIPIKWAYRRPAQK